MFSMYDISLLCGVAKMIIVVLSVLLYMTTVSALEPSSDYILEVSIECGESTSSSPVITILTDLDISAVARCVGADVAFTTKDHVHYEKTASYTIEDAAAGDCILRNTKGTHEAEVIVSFGNNDGRLLTKPQVFPVSCTVESSGKNPSKLNTNPGPIVPKRLVTHIVDTTASGKITLELQNVKEQKINGIAPMDKLVSLYAISDETVSESGLKVVSCYAKNTNGDTYGILKSGCGDGLIFHRDAGFKTVGKTARSPYFRSFPLEGDTNVTYECEFLLCTTDCDGNSCDPMHVK